MELNKPLLFDANQEKLLYMGRFNISRLWKVPSSKDEKTVPYESSESIWVTDTLLARLKDIAEDKTEYQISRGAMCYSPVAFDYKYKACKCSVCNRKIQGFEVNEYAELVKEAGQIKKTELAEVKIVCKDCLLDMCKSGNYSFDVKEWYGCNWEYLKTRTKIASDSDDLVLLNSFINAQEDRWDRDERKEDSHYLVFLFKTADGNKAHLSVTDPYCLHYFLAFIQNKRTWKDDYDATVLLREHIEIIERLTGLKL